MVRRWQQRVVVAAAATALAAGCKSASAPAQPPPAVTVARPTSESVADYLDFTVVLNAEENLYQAQNNLAVARGNIPLGLIATYRALGGGWQLREGNDFVPDATRAEMARRTNWGTWLTPDLLRPQAPGLPSPEDRGPLVRPPEW